jgi:hypothetical protein
MRLARDLFAQMAPDIECDGELQGDAALSEDVRRNALMETTLTGEANLLICPNLDSANILFNVLKMTGGNGVTVGPILLGAAGFGARPDAFGDRAARGQHDGAGRGQRLDGVEVSRQSLPAFQKRPAVVGAGRFFMFLTRGQATSAHRRGRPGRVRTNRVRAPFLLECRTVFAFTFTDENSRMNKRLLLQSFLAASALSFGLSPAFAQPRRRSSSSSTGASKARPPCSCTRPPRATSRTPSST